MKKPATNVVALGSALPFDVEKVRADFPILGANVRGKPLVYLDNAASTQKPKAVIERVRTFYEGEYSNVHRGIHTLSQEATDSYEEARHGVRDFICAQSEKEIIFTRGATEGINLVAQSFGRSRLKHGDEIVISAMEHHSGIVPWQMLCQQTGATLKVIPMNMRGELLMDEYEKILSPKVKLISVVHVSNALGTINPVKEMIALAHKKHIPVVVDGAQALPHVPVDVRDLDCDFYVFSGHKIYGPSGVGVLYGKEEWLDQMPPYQGGGDMIASVSFQRTTYNTLPYKFEAGTPNIEGAIGLGAALQYLKSIGWEKALAYEHGVFEYAQERISALPKIQLIGQASHKTAVVSFVIEGVHPHDAGTILDSEGIAVRAGHHCAQPVMDFFHVPATLRASFSFYNTKAEVDRLVEGIKKVLEIFK